MLELTNQHYCEVVQQVLSHILDDVVRTEYNENADRTSYQHGGLTYQKSNFDSFNEFCWEEYLNVTGTFSTDCLTNFSHVTKSLSSAHVINNSQIIGLCSKINGFLTSYWPCKIVSRNYNYVCLMPFKCTTLTHIWKSLNDDCISIKKAQELNLKLNFETVVDGKMLTYTYAFLFIFTIINGA